jgi:HYR domain/RTX calcium-binding nonapeptide repeat (4 copies)
MRRTILAGVCCLLLAPAAAQAALPEGFEAGTLGAFASSSPVCASAPCGWSSVTTDKHSGLRSAFAPDRNVLTDQHLAHGRILVPPAGTIPRLIFWHRFNLESGFDGGVLELSEDNGVTWSTTAPTFVSGGYTGTISVNFGSALAGRNAWTGDNGLWQRVEVNLTAYAGKLLSFRFRLASDSSVSDVGWWIDDLSGFRHPTAPDQAGTVVTYTPPPSGAPLFNLVGCSPAPGSFFPVGNTTVTCSYVRSVPLATLTRTFTVSVGDVQPPSITVPANRTVSNAPNQAAAVVTYPPPVVSDNVPGVTTICSPASGSTFPLGTTSVTCTATDAAGNTATGSFTVRVVDTQPPTIDAPPNMTVGNDPGRANAVVTYPPPTASDNAPGVSSACTPPSGGTFSLGATTVTCTATDAAGNTATDSFTVTVRDAELPVFAPTAGVVTPNDVGKLHKVLSYAPPAATDNAGAAVAVACSPAPGSIFPVGRTFVACTGTDAAGNAATTSFAVEVRMTLCRNGTRRGDRLNGAADGDFLCGGAGSDRIRGLAGNDVLRGDAGTDTIDTGRGQDQVAGGSGNDLVKARDGARDTIDCGGGSDTVVADRLDVVRRCEIVRRR